MSEFSDNTAPSCPRPLKRSYETDFAVSPDYRASLPDMQNRDASAVTGAHVPIIQVGMHNFRLPLMYAVEDGPARQLETSITGTVGLCADRKGINMSRIMRVLYEYEHETVSPELLEQILRHYEQQLDSPRARIRFAFNFPMRQQSLRSGLQGWQYYACAYEGHLSPERGMERHIHFDFVYSSACPCSGDLAEHARDQRQIYAVSHSQRSKARVKVALTQGHRLSLEQMQRICRKALQTETQVMVKREDEQAFAELNGAYEKFVEDAARLLYEGFADEPAVADFEIACAHLESLHSHDAVAVIHKGVEGGFTGNFDNFRDLLC